MARYGPAMAVALGLLVALTYGSGDFFGGLAAKRTKAPTVVVGSFGLAAVLLALITLAWGLIGGLPHLAAHDARLGVAAGCIGPIAVVFLYHGLSTGRMSVVAPITAVIAAIVPFTWGLLHGERPAAISLFGVALALVAVGLISGAPAPTDGATGPTDGPPPLRSSGNPVPGAVVAGLGFGIVFVLLGTTTDHAGLWPLLIGRATATLLLLSALGGFALVARRRGTLGPGGVAAVIVPVRAAWPAIAVSGVLDSTANGIYLSATHRGLLSIVAVLSSLYPASTVLLARVVLHERFHRVQVAGLALAVVGVVAMTAG